MKLLLFNGPPRTGKTTICDLADGHFDSLLAHVEFSSAVTDAVRGLYPSFRFDEATKDKPQAGLHGLTTRQAQINIGEQMKVWHGNTYWAEVVGNALDTAKGCGWNVGLVGGMGFQYEYDYLVDKFGVQNTILVQTNRDGYTFDNDSRDYVVPRDEQLVYTIHADSPEELDEQAVKLFDYVKHTMGVA